MHLSSCEPHKRTAHLVKWWHGAERLGGPLPKLHLIGNVPGEVGMLVAECETIVQRPFLSDQELEAAYRGAKAIILPSEIEGFGLPALEAYYLGTPVCFVAGTSVEEILAPATRRGRFHLHDEASFWSALGDVMAMAPAEVRDHGLKLRGIYAASVVAERMLAVFEQVSRAVGEPKRA
jgi:glycosyltransferase involved in cell wall biosynthesis